MTDIPEYIRRYAERLVAGPAVKEYSFPVNHEREEPEIAKAIYKHLYAVAAAIEAGFEPETYWPLASKNDPQ